MADILCPSCGKPNPEALEICQYCGTLLKNRGTEPLAPIHPGEMPTPKKTAELERTLPAWLRDIRKGGAPENSAADPAAPAPSEPPKQQPPKPQPPQPSDASPLDFLAGLSKDSEEEDDVPDWLAGLKGGLPAGPVPSPEPPAPAASSAPAAPAHEPADWLAGLQGGASFDAAPTPDTDVPLEEPAAQTPPAVANPDWLNALQTPDESIRAAQTAPLASPPAEDFPPIQGLPDWLSGLVGSSGEDDIPPAPSSSQPFAMPPAPAPSAPAQSEPAAAPIPEPPASATDVPDWLAGLGPTPAPAAVNPSEPTPASETPADGETTDWLAGLTAAAAAGPAFTPKAPGEEVPPAAGEVPDWLAGLGSASPAASAPAGSPADEISPAAEPTDWLAGLSAAGPAMTGETPADETPAAPGVVPDWLAGLATEPAATPAPELAPPPTPPTTETPPPAADLPDASKVFSTGSLHELGTLGGTGGLPDWMAALSIGGAAAHEAAPPPEAKSPDTTGAAAFAWSEQAGSGGSQPPTQNVPSESPATEGIPPVPAPEGEQNLDAILSMDMPDWLSGFAPTESEPATQPRDPQAAGANISPADLPSWVQAMRPMESVITGPEQGGDDQNVEHEGPLAGLRSVLPAQPEAFGLRKPKAYSIKLQVDATQQAQAALLEKLIASEAESQPVALPKRVAVSRPLRWIIAALLLLAVLIPSLFPRDLLAAIFPPPLAVEEVTTFRDVIQHLPDSAPVLVVFDYQPGYAGEMQQVAGPIVDDLIGKQARLVFVSTSPQGSLMSANLMAGHSYAPENYVDLGYLPGGAAGIQVFASTPQILEFDLRNGDLWSRPALAGVADFSSFKAVIVLTDNSDTGRQWIEQTSQVLQTRGALIPPMLMAISAQAEPMIRPYYPGQIAGMISGLAGGAMYEQLSQHPGKAGEYWGSFGAGALTAALLIVVGGAWALFENLRARRTQQEQTEEDEA